MPKIDSRPMGAPCWLDLSTSDMKRAAEFYGALFAWNVIDTGEEFGHYHMASKGDAGIAGMMLKDDTQRDQPDAWMVYLAVPDAAAIAVAVREAGGQVVFDADQVGELGAMTIATDPTGAWVGFWQSGQHKGFELWGEHGAPAWHELHTRDFDAASAFYGKVLGVEVADMDMEGGPQYRTMKIDGEDQAGIMDAAAFLPEGVPSHWTVYFGVDDTDQVVALAQELGGSLRSAVENTPFGRMATVSDPMGATFNVISVGEEPA